MKIVRVLAAAAAAIGLMNAPAQAAVLVSNTTGSSTATNFVGQSFTLGGATTDYYNNLSFSFFSGTTAVASGILSIFSAAVTTGATATSTATANLVARSTGVAGGIYQFDAGTTLAGGTKYYAYSSASQTVSYSATDVLSGGNRYTATSATAAYTNSTTSDARFSFMGVLAVPEPASWAMMLAGFGLVGRSLRRQRRVASPLG